MAVEGPQPVKWSFVAGADLSAKQYYFVKSNGTDNQVIVCAAATDVPIGVLQNAPASGGVAEVCIAGITKVSSDAALTAGNRIGTSADGQAGAKTAGTDTTEYAVGIVIIGTGAAAGLATAVINCAGAGRDA
jgi:hypothetical protein